MAFILTSSPSLNGAACSAFARTARPAVARSTAVLSAVFFFLVFCLAAAGFVTFVVDVSFARSAAASLAGPD